MESQIRRAVADRYKKALFDEDIIVFPTVSLSKYVPSIGIHRNSFDRDALLTVCRPMRRRAAEEDLTVIQLVSVFVVHHGERYLTYKRTRRLRKRDSTAVIPWPSVDI